MSRCVVSPPAVCALTRRCAVASPGRRLRRKQFGVPKAEGTIVFAEAVLVRVPTAPVAAMSATVNLRWTFGDAQRKRFLGRGKYCMIAIWDDQRPERCVCALALFYSAWC